MLETLVVIFRLIGLLCRGHGALALENLPLRPQLAALTRTRKRPQVRPSDRLFWCLASVWRCWRSALVVVRLTLRALASPMAPPPPTVGSSHSGKSAACTTTVTNDAPVVRQNEIVSFAG